MKTLNSPEQTNSIEKQEQLENLYKELFNILGNYLLDNKIYGKVNKVVDKIYGLDVWIWHDIRNIILFIYEYSMKLKRNNPKDDKDKIQNNIKQQFKKLNELFYWKEYDTTEIMKDILEISNRMDIDINIHLINNIMLSMWNDLHKDISINSWKIENIDERLILKNSTNNIRISFITKLLNLFNNNEKKYNEDNLELKNYFWRFNAPLYRIFINTITNAKQAWATKVDVYVSHMMASQRLMFKIVDNGKWMDKNTIESVLFKKWESKKKESWINYWVWMYGIAKLVWSYNWEMEVYSKQWDTKIKWLYANYSLSEEEIKPISDIKYIDKKDIYQTCIKSENWSEFVFKLPVYDKK